MESLALDFALPLRVALSTEMLNNLQKVTQHQVPRSEALPSGVPPPLGPALLTRWLGGLRGAEGGTLWAEGPVMDVQREQQASFWKPAAAWFSLNASPTWLRVHVTRAVLDLTSLSAAPSLLRSSRARRRGNAPSSPRCLALSYLPRTFLSQPSQRPRASLAFCAMAALRRPALHTVRFRPMRAGREGRISRFPGPGVGLQTH